MGKAIHNDVLDAALNLIKNNANRISVCNAEPTTITQLTTTYMLAIKNITSTDFTGPAAGDVSGRKLTSNQHTSVDILNSGTANHVALGDTTNSRVLLVTTCTAQALTAGGTVTIGAFKDEIAAPS